MPIGLTGNGNIVLGTISILAAIVLCAFASQAAKRGQWQKAVFLLVMCGLVLRVFASLDGALHDWDERYHALVARHLLLHPLKPTLYEHPLLPYDLHNWTSNSIWLHKQPLTLWLMAVSLKIFGINVLSVRLPSIVLSSLLIPLVYDIGARLFSKRIGFISAFLCTIHGFLIDVVSGRAATDHIDATFLFFVTLGVWAAVKYASQPQKKWLVITGVAIGAGVLTKWLPAFIVLPLFLMARYHWGKPSGKALLFEIAIIAGIAVGIAGPWQWYILSHYPAEAAWEYSYNAAHMRTALEGHSGSFFYHFNNLRIQYGEAVYLPIILFTVAAIRTKKAAFLLVASWFWMVYLFFSIVATKMAAYPLIAAPAIWIMTAWGIDSFAKKERISRFPKWLSYTIAIALVALPVRYSLERLKPFSMIDRQPHQLNLPNAGAGKPVVVFNARYPIEEMFFGNCVAYEQDVDSNIQVRLKGAGYRVVRAQ